MKKYFLYELKKYIFPISMLTLVAMVYYVAPLLISDLNYSGYGTDVLGQMSFIGGVIAVIMPIELFAYKMKKRSVDLYYSLPLSHTKILIVKYLIGLIVIFIPYTVTYWLGAFTVMAKAFDYIHAVWYVPQFLASILPIYVLYSISSFAYTRANKSGDGLVFILFWMFAVSFVVMVINEIFVGARSYSYFYLPFAPLDSATSYFMNLIRYGSAEVVTETAEIVHTAIGFTITTLLSVGSTVGLILTEKHAKAENAGQISDSYFGYRTMIPLYTAGFIGLTSFDYGINVLLIIMILICSFVITVLYRRTAKIGKKQLIILGITVVVGIVLALMNTFITPLPDYYPFEPYI